MSDAAPGGEVVAAHTASAALGREWRYRVYLPAGYAASGLRYPTLYLLHGRGGNEGSWEADGQVGAVLDRLVATGTIPPVLAVMPDAGSSWYVDAAAERMESAIVRELVPQVDGRYRTIPERRGRAVVGYSMGGYGALRYALVHAGLFGAAVLLSPAVYDRDPPEDSSARALAAFGRPFDPAAWRALNYPAALERFLPAGLRLPVFVAAGDDEHVPARPRDNVAVQAAELQARLRAAGQPARLRILAGGHDWGVWAPALLEGLEYALANLARPEPAARPSATEQEPA